MEEVELHLPADVAYVGLARLVVCAAARHAGMTEERVEDLRIAVSEATTSACIARQRDAHEGDDHSRPVLLSFGPRESGMFGVTITGVTPDTSAPEASDQRSGWLDETSLGATVIRGLADDVRFVSRDDGVNLEFTVALADARQAVDNAISDAS